MLITYIMYKFDQAIYYDIGGSEGGASENQVFFKPNFFIPKLIFRDFCELFSCSNNASFPQRMMSPSPKRAGRASEQISTVLSKYLMRWVLRLIKYQNWRNEHFQTIFNDLQQTSARRFKATTLCLCGWDGSLAGLLNMHKTHVYTGVMLHRELWKSI